MVNVMPVSREEGNLFEVLKSKIDIDTFKNREKEMKQNIFHEL